MRMRRPDFVQLGGYRAFDRPVITFPCLPALASPDDNTEHVRDEMGFSALLALSCPDGAAQLADRTTGYRLFGNRIRQCVPCAGAGGAQSCLPWSESAPQQRPPCPSWRRLSLNVDIAPPISGGVKNEQRGAPK